LKKVLDKPERLGFALSRQQRPMTKKPNAVESARIFGCTIEQAKRLFAKNADEALTMIERAKANGGRYRNYSLAQLVQMERDYREASA